MIRIKEVAIHNQFMHIISFPTKSTHTHSPSLFPSTTWTPTIIMYGTILFLITPAANNLHVAAGFDAKYENNPYACWATNSGQLEMNA